MIPYTVRPLTPWTGTRSPFSASWQATLELIDREVRHLGAQSWVLQVDVPESQIRRDGGIYARAIVGTPAVKVAFESRHGPLTYQCDRFDRWQDNVRAIALSLAASHAHAVRRASLKSELPRPSSAPPRLTPFPLCRNGSELFRKDERRFLQWTRSCEHRATSEALRKVDRYGVARRGEQYRGWTALEQRPAEMTREQAADFLVHWAGLFGHDGTPGLRGTDLLADLGQLPAVYRAAAKRAHPDVTGDDGDTMARLNAARDLLLNGAHP